VSRADARPSRAGLLLLDKPAGGSSFGAIAGLRPVLGRRVGHAGTLDPFATGLLLVLAGRATRLARFLSGLDKRYRATVRFGERSTTDDPEGELEPTGARTDEAAVTAALAGLRGPIVQVPPAASAIHVDGERAYRRFRRGETVTVPARAVTVHALELVAFDEERQQAELDVRCSTGTYVRAIARDLGEAVGTGAHCAALRRTAVGPFDVADAATPEAARAQPFAAPHWREPADAVGHLASVRLDDAALAAVRHGRAVPVAAADGPVALLAPDGALVAVGAAVDGVARPETVLEAS
jgi:tRNA pseudouridine55 synthase